MTTCTGMQRDIREIEDWATIFTQPTTLSKTVAKNWLFHGRQIRKDIDQEEADWAAGDYFDAGKDTAEALMLAVGPMKAELYQTSVSLPDIKGPVEFLAGLLDGLVGENHLD